jgi:hypothetical protein
MSLGPISQLVDGGVVLVYGERLQEREASRRDDGPRTRQVRPLLRHGFNSRNWGRCL